MVRTNSNPIPKQISKMLRENFHLVIVILCSLIGLFVLSKKYSERFQGISIESSSQKVQINDNLSVKIIGPQYKWGPGGPRTNLLSVKKDNVSGAYILLYQNPGITAIDDRSQIYTITFSKPVTLMRKHWMFSQKNITSIFTVNYENVSHLYMYGKNREIYPERGPLDYSNPFKTTADWNIPDKLENVKSIIWSPRGKDKGYWSFFILGEPSKNEQSTAAEAKAEEEIELRKVEEAEAKKQAQAQAKGEDDVKNRNGSIVLNCEYFTFGSRLAGSCYAEALKHFRKSYQENRPFLVYINPDDGIIKENAFSSPLFGIVFISSKVRVISKNAFSGCTMLKRVIFSDDSQLETIGETAFKDCPALKVINIPCSVKNVHDTAFLGTNLNRITLPSLSLLLPSFKNKKISINIRQNCDYEFVPLHPSLATSKVPKNLTDKHMSIYVEKIIEGAFMNNENIETVFISSSVKEIGAKAFRGCKKLKEVIFSDDIVLNKIGRSAFSNCINLISIEIPFHLKSKNIGNNAFRYCKNLKSVTISESLYEELNYQKVCYYGNNSSRCTKISKLYNVFSKYTNVHRITLPKHPSGIPLELSLRAGETQYENVHPASRIPHFNKIKLL